MSEASAIEFERDRPFLTGLAYRMLGSFADAQDIVQDAFLRWHGAASADIANRRGWLATVVTRLCLDRLGSARARRESYVGAWLPDPVVETLAAPEREAPDARIDAPVALMLAMERLSPLERAAFVLHDLMDIEMGELSAALQRSEGACRQLLMRARAHVGEPKARFPVATEEGAQIAAAFFAAVETGEVGPLRDLLAEQAVMISDGGGKVIATLNPVRGGDKVYRFFRGIAAKGRPGRWSWSGPLTVSGLPGYVAIDANGILHTTAFAIENGRIMAVYTVRNPDKLKGLASFVETRADIRA